MSRVKSRATKESNPWAGLEAALSATAVDRSPPPGYWNAEELAKKLSRSRSIAQDHISAWKKLDMLDVWEGSSPNGGRVWRYRFKKGGAL